MKKILCHLSGGFDSLASTLAIAETGEGFGTVFFNYDQIYWRQESKAVHECVAFLSKTFPNYLGHTQIQVDMSLGAPGEVAAYIPVRNLVLGAHSINLAISQGYTLIAVGNKTTQVREGDPYSFNDCSVDFYKRLGDLGTFASQGKSVQFLMPLVKGGVAITKTQVIKSILDHGFDPKLLWSCYENQSKPCGSCYHCEEVTKAGFGYLLDV